MAPGALDPVQEPSAPDHELPLALPAFNLVVEVGQLIVLGTIKTGLATARQLSRSWTAALNSGCAAERRRLGSCYAIGTLSSAGRPVAFMPMAP